MPASFQYPVLYLQIRLHLHDRCQLHPAASTYYRLPCPPYIHTYDTQMYVHLASSLYFVAGQGIHVFTTVLLCEFSFFLLYVIITCGSGTHISYSHKVKKKPENSPHCSDKYTIIPFVAGCRRSHAAQLLYGKVLNLPKNIYMWSHPL